MFMRILIFILFSAPVFGAQGLLEKQGRTDEIKSGSSNNEESKPLVFKNTLEFENSVNNEAASTQRLACEAALSLNYSQNISNLVIDAAVTNYTCEASRGRYRISVEYLDVSGQPSLYEVEENWQKDSATDFYGLHKYPFDFDAEITKVRGQLLKKDGCVCLSEPTAEDAQN